MIKRLWVVAVVGLAACAGPDTSFRDLFPVVAVNPVVLDFGEVGPPLSSTEIVFVGNTGLSDLEITSAEVRGGRGTFSIDELKFIVGSDDTHELAITFAPETFVTYDATLVLTTNDEEHPEETVLLTGVGVDLPLPDIDIRPGRTIEVVDVPTGEDEIMAFEIANDGDSPLDITDVIFDGPPVFEVKIDPKGATVGPNAFTAMIVEYTPTGDQGDSATVTILSNDPDEPSTDVLLLGNGGGDFEYPEAVVDCPTGDVQLLGPEWVHFDGSSSYDPAGHEPLDYRWLVLSRPAGADPGNFFDPDNQATADLFVDAAGTWNVALQVINSLGTASVPALCTFGAVPADDLHIELSWDTALADIDLHLAEGGATLFETPGDCNYCNKSPDWGGSGADDDPRLDLDDVEGFGPENINILDPAEATFDVRAHYFEEHGDGPVVATVKIYTYGLEVWSDSQVLTENQVWEVGTVDMPSGIFFPQPAGTVDFAGPQTCQ